MIFLPAMAVRSSDSSTGNKECASSRVNVRSGMFPFYSTVSEANRDVRLFHRPLNRNNSVRSKLKCPVFVASEMSGFKVFPPPFGFGFFWGGGCGGRGDFPFPLLSSVEALAGKDAPPAS